ncbi:MAG TPA: M28 family peptidase [Allosphingosinicella sp.]
MKRRALLLAAGLLTLLLALVFKGGLLELPDVPTAAPGQFDTQRALSRLERILGPQVPHPIDSDANDAVRDRLLAEMRAIGLTPRVEDRFTCNGSAEGRTIACARVRNLVATTGPTQGRHLLLVSHYDSTPAGPGAADDGIGVATMLETAFLLRNEKLARPVTFLINEGEETGLIGARAFLDGDPVAGRVDSLINLESRGVTGPAIMFETSRPNGPAVAAFARSSARPVANSMTTDFYRLIPNSTDVAVFEEKDWTILNFAVIGNETRYHSPGDDFAALDPRSVAHMGVQALATARTLARSPAAAEGDRLYADIAGRILVDFPVPVGLALLALLILLFPWLCRRRPGGIGRSAAAIGAAMLGSLAVAFVAQLLLGLVRPGAWWRAWPEAAGAGVYGAAIAVSLLAILLLARPIARDRLRAAFWLIFLLLGAAISFVAPGAAIFFLLPPMAAAVGMLAEERRPGAERVGAVLAWLILFLTWAPLLDLTETLLDMDAAWIFAPVAALILMPALIELKPLATRLPARTLTMALAGLAALAWVPALVAPAYSNDRKQEFVIEYVRDATKGDARWMVMHDGAPLPAAFTSLGRAEEGLEVPWSTRKRRAFPAPVLPLEAPALDRIGEMPTQGGRIVSLRLMARGAQVVRLRFEPEAGLRSARTGGSARRFGKGGKEDDYVLRCHGRSCDGLRIDLHIAGSAPVEAILVGTRSGLPAEAAPLVESRPALASPQYVADSSIAVATVRF